MGKNQYLFLLVIKLEIRSNYTLKSQARVNWQPLLREMNYDERFIDSLKSDRTEYYFVSESNPTNIYRFLGYADPARPYQRVKFTSKLNNEFGTLIIVFDTNFAAIGKRKLFKGKRGNTDYSIVIQYNIIITKDSWLYNNDLLQLALIDLAKQFEEYPPEFDSELDHIWAILKDQFYNFDLSFEEITEEFNPDYAMIDFINELEHEYTFGDQNLVTFVNERDIIIEKQNGEIRFRFER